MYSLNLGILAHVDAGKTSLTERLLFAAGAIDKIGTVNRGDTQTDTLAQERQRGITIKSAVATFAVDRLTVNLIDTPGHPDFIAEVERALMVLDGAILVVSAVEGVQAQTRVLMRALQRMRIPTVVFLNKVDRSGADVGAVSAAIKRRLSPAIVEMSRVVDPGTPRAQAYPLDRDDPEFARVLVDRLTEHDDLLLADYLEGRVTRHRLWRQLGSQTRRSMVHPVFMGSAATGAGVEGLLSALPHLLAPKRPDPDGPPSGYVFKVERGQSGEKIAWVRMFSGRIAVRDKIVFRGTEQRLTDVAAFSNGTQLVRRAAGPGEIAKLWGLKAVRIGDAFGNVPNRDGGLAFGSPTLEAAIAPKRIGDRQLLFAALAQMAEQDPLIDLRQDDLRGVISLSMYGEVQKDVIAQSLREDYGLDVEFRETTTICIERPLGTGEALEVIRDGRNPFLATIGLRIDPLPAGAGISYELEVSRGSMPLAFHNAVEDAVRRTLSQGLKGWEVTDCRVTLVRAGYWARQSHSHATFDKGMSSTAGDFRNLAPLVVMEALTRAGTRVYEPQHGFELEVPVDLLPKVLPLVRRLGVLTETPTTGGELCVLRGEILAANVHELRQHLPAATRGEGVLETAFLRYQLRLASVPSRPRTDFDPLDRTAYLLRVARRSAG